MAIDTYFFFGIFECITQPVTIIGNLLTMIAFLKVPSLQTHTSNRLIFALSIADMISGLYQLFYFGIPFAFGLPPPFGEIGCMMIGPLEYTYNAGNFLLVAISIDRVLLVSMDYSNYLKMMTKPRVRGAIVTCFGISYAAFFFELSLWNYAKENNAIAAGIDFTKTCLRPPRRMKWFSIFLSVCFFALPLLLVGLLSILFVKGLLKRIGKTRRIGPSSTTTSESNQESPDEDGSQGTVKKRYMKSAVTLAALVSAMCVSMLPYLTYLLIVGISGSFSSAMNFIMYLVLQLNPFLDPLFYAATQKGIREFYGSKIRALFRTIGGVFQNP